MGKTAFSGPAWGSYGLLWSATQDVGRVSTAASTIASIAVPAGEDWYIMRLAVTRDTAQSTSLVVSLLDDSTSIATVALTSSLADAHGSTRLTPDSGEYAGVRVVTGSTLSIVLTAAESSAAALTSSGVHAYVYGYARWLPSTIRTE